MGTTLVYNIGELATLAGGVRFGRDPMNDLAIEINAAVAVVDGTVEEVGPNDEMVRRWRRESDIRVNAGGRAAVPGFVDPHTHAVFAGDRAYELELKLKGLTYGEILAQGGGILHTVERTRDATRAELLKNVYRTLDKMLDHGTTTVEIKTGYGLDLATEGACLDAVNEASADHPMDVVPTLMPAHAIPPDVKADDFVDLCVEEIIPALAAEAEYGDVFCDEGVFTVDQSRRILEASADAGLGLKVHADELAHSGGSLLAAEMGCVSADHLLKVTAEDRAALLESGVVPVLLPATAFSLNVPYAPARAFVDEGHPVAIASDHNPNCHGVSVPFAIQLACYGMRMTPAEALSAATVNAAAALEREDEVGSIEAGMLGDIVILDAPSYQHIPYNIGENPVWKVLKEGDVVVDVGR